jgi:hypothetical protein
MRNIFFAISLTAVLTLTLAPGGVSPTNFSGTWVLDKNKSQALSDDEQRAESVTLEIRQDESR